MIISDCVNSFGLICSDPVNSFELITSASVHSLGLICSAFVHSFKLIISDYVNFFELISVNPVPFVGFFLPVPSGLLFPRQILPAPAGQRRFFLAASGQARFLLPSLRRCGNSFLNVCFSHHFLIFAKKTFLLAPLGRAKFVQPLFLSHDVDSQNLCLPTTRGGRFCKNENLCNFQKTGSVLP